MSYQFIEWIVLLTGIVYVFYAAKNNPICWIWGIISCGLLSYLSFSYYKLFADGYLQVLYVIMGFIGIYQWKSKSDDQTEQIKKLKNQSHVLLIIGGIVVSVISGYLLQQYSGAFATYIDSFTSVFGIIATGLLIKRYIGNWIYWIVIDLIMAYLYLTRGMALEDGSGWKTAALMLIYTGVAIYGWLEWKREMLRIRDVDKTARS